MCMYRCEYLIKETLVTVRMRILQTLCLVLFACSLFLWQRNLKEGQEDNCTEVWAQKMHFPKVTTFTSFLLRVAAFPFWSRQPSNYRSVSGLVYNLYFKCSVQKFSQDPVLWIFRKSHQSKTRDRGQTAISFFCWVLCISLAALHFFFL